MRHYPSEAVGSIIHLGNCLHCLSQSTDISNPTVNWIMRNINSSRRRGSEPRMVRGTNNSLLLPFQMKKSVMMLRKKSRPLSLSQPELEDRDMDIFKESANFVRWKLEIWNIINKIKHLNLNVSPNPEENKELEDRLKLIVKSLENLVKSLRSKETVPISVNIGTTYDYDVDKILLSYRELNQPLILNIGGLRFR